MAEVNHAFRLAARPVGLPTRDIFDYVEEDVREPDEGEVMRAGGVAEVLESRFEGVQAGDHVTGIFGVQEFAVVPGAGVTKVDPALAPLPRWLGALGMPGMTAYFGLLEIGRPEPGQTVVVSAAAGAVGHLVGQIARIKGARAVGIAGGPDKCSYITDELGFDAAIDYKSEDVPKALRHHCPDGIDVYFDNVGGDILDAALAQLARGARIPLCGAISQYNAEGGEFRGPVNYLSLLVNRATMRGFIVFDFAARYPEGVAEIGKWLASGEVKTREHVVEGLETFPDTLLMLFNGTNYAKLVLGVAGG